MESEKFRDDGSVQVEGWRALESDGAGEVEGMCMTWGARVWMLEGLRVVVDAWSLD